MVRLLLHLWRRAVTCNAVGHDWQSAASRFERFDVEAFAASGAVYAEEYVARRCSQCGMREPA